MSDGLVHEVWLDEQDLEMCCLAGPDGNDARALHGPNARLLHVFTACSYFEAMCKYHAFLDREPYTTNHAWDFEPFPPDWYERQEAAAHEWRALHARLLPREPDQM